MLVKNLRDCPEAVELLARWFVDGFSHENADYEEERSWLSRSLDYLSELPVTFIAFEGSVPVGTARIFYDEMPDRPQCNPWMGYAYVIPAARRQGVLRWLYEAMTAYCAAHRITRVYCYTSMLTAAAEAHG